MSVPLVPAAPNLGKEDLVAVGDSHGDAVDVDLLAGATISVHPAIGTGSTSTLTHPARVEVPAKVRLAGMPPYRVDSVIQQAAQHPRRLLVNLHTLGEEIGRRLVIRPSAAGEERSRRPTTAFLAREQVANHVGGVGFAVCLR